MKGFRFLTLVLALMTLTICWGWSNVAFASASGTIKMKIDTDVTGKITSAQGSAILFSDNTSWWSTTQWVGDYAQVDGYIDGTWAGKILTFIYTRAPNYIDDVRDHTEKAVYWWPSQLEPGKHTISYRMRDIYSGEGYTTGGYKKEIGNLITEYQVHVYVDETGQQFLRHSKPLNLGNGPMQCGGMRGEPVYIGTGNSFQQETDIKISGPGTGLSLVRTYNSQSDTVGPFGFGWTHNYDLRLNEIDALHVEVKRADGGTSLFIKNPDDIYQEIAGRPTSIEALIVDDNLQGWRWHRLDGGVFEFDASGRLLKISKLGNTTIFTYDTSGRLENINDLATGRSLQFQYNAQGLITSISGPITPAIPTGIWANYLYDENQNLKSVTYADGSDLDYIYTDPHDIHNLTEKRDRIGHLLATWTYDDQDRVTGNWSRDGRGIDIDYTGYNTRTVTDAYGSTSTYSFAVLNGYKVFTEKNGGIPCRNCGGSVVAKKYDSDLRVTEIQYANGLKRQFDDFDANGNARVLTIQPGTPEEKTIVRTFHPEIRAKLSQSEPSVLGAGDKVTVWDYDDDGDAVPNENPTQLPHRKIERGFTRDISGDIIPYEFITTYSYDSKGNILSIDGPQPGTGDTTTFTYDAATGDLLSITRPVLGTTTCSQYGADGRVGRITDPNGNATLYTYDGRGRVLTITREGNGKTTYSYNPAGDIAGITQPNGVAANFTYDTTYGRLIRIEDTLGNYTLLSYDSQGNRIELSRYNAVGRLVFRKRFDYQAPDNPGKLWKEINPDDTFTEYAYDSSGNTAAITDASGKTTSYSYDPLNRVTTVTQPGNVITAYTYDSQNNLAGVTDAENHTTTYVHDDLGRLGAVTSPDTETTAYAYDAAGNLTAKRDANGNTISYTYDELNRLTAIHFPDPSQDITYTYDAGVNGKGRLTGMADSSGTSAYFYDSLGRLEKGEVTLDGITYTTSYAYDPAGLLTAITYPSGRVVTYERDIAGNLTRVATTRDGETQTLAENITHLPFGPVIGMTYGNGIAITKTFDQLYQLTHLQAGSIEDFTYSRDPVGNITTITDHLDSTKGLHFTYDDLYRLTDASGIEGTFRYTYDKVGNRLTRTDGLNTDVYTYAPGTNRLTEITGANPATFGYDANGNTTALGAKSLAYNQNNRLIQVAENGTPLGAYVYNGKGQRTKKATDEGTVYFLYDKDGNLIAEADNQGAILREYIYAEGSRLAMIQAETSEEIRVTVSSSKRGALSGIRVYAFTTAGSYTGQYADTDEHGTAVFPPGNFSDGSYVFRADYLGCHFWSQDILIPGTLTAQVVIEEETTQATVTAAGSPEPGVRVYLFSEGGSYLGLYSTTDSDGKVSFDLPAGHVFKFRADCLSNHYWSNPIPITPGQTTTLTVATGGGILTVTAENETGSPLVGLKLYLFSPSGAYLGRSGTSDESGRISFSVPAGSFKIRADYLGYHFWTDIIPVDADTSYSLTIPHRDVTITVNGDLNGDILPIEGLHVYLFSPAGSYLGMSQNTDQQGQTTFTLPSKEYQVRADYLARHYWSDGFTWEDSTVTIPEGQAEVTVTNMGLPLEDIRVYVFYPEGPYLGLHSETNAEGAAVFRLPEGEYTFRADYLGNQYWSGNSTIIPHVSNPVTISTGGGVFTLTVLGNQGLPLENVPCYLFTESGAYLGKKQVTTSQGEANFNLADGTYKVRIDYLGYQFWTESFTVPGTATLTKTITHRDVTITVNGDYDGDVLPFSNLKTYLFSPTGSYLNRSGTTDAGGSVTFSLPEQEYKVRADYLNVHYWSDIFDGQDTSIHISEGVAEVHVSQSQNPLPNVNVYVFSASNAYLGIHEKTDAQGIVSFRLPAGTYNFRADYQGSHYWSTAPVQADQVNEINLDTGGGSVALTVEKTPGEPLTDISVYVFTSNGAYLGMTARTDSQGLASFDLSDGWYKFRVDYLGYQFWTEPFEVPQSLSQVLTIPHQDVVITVNKVYEYDSAPLERTRVYLFTENGAYQGIYADTDTQGRVIFHVPQKSYKARADYLRNHYWSDASAWENREINIEHGKVRLHVTYNGSNLEDVPVYLFSEQGAYLGKSERTDAYGDASFTIPAKSYKFRVDYNGTQYWSDPVNVIPNDEIEVSLALEQLALDLTNDPNPVRFDGKPPVFRPAKIQVASIGSLAGILLQGIAGQVTTEKVYYFINDHLGTPQKIMDENGAVVWSANYQPFGEASLSSETVANNFRFPGQYYDAETGLHYNHHRYYNPHTGRYLTPDPLHLGAVQIARQNCQIIADATLLYQYAFFAPQAFSYYSYVYSNPVNWTDPMGLMGFALSGGGAYGSGKGRTDPNAYSAAAGSGIYIGARKAGYAELGGFSYQAEGKLPGAKFGVGIDLTLYYTDAQNFFQGPLKYSSRTWGPFTVTEYYNECGEVIGHTFSILGRGLGLTGLVRGESRGWIYPLQ